MLSVILVWCYMAFTMFVTGFGVLKLLAARLSVSGKWQAKHLDTCLMCGFVCVTVYAQFFSLVCKIGLAANAVMCLVCAVILWKYRATFLEKLTDIKNIVKQRRGRILVILFLLFLFAYGTSRGIIHYDTSLYHAQSIRWLEEYGVVKGLGNLHCRLAYNSSSFALSALYSMAFLGGQSYHCAAGFLAFILSKVCLEMADSFHRRRLHTSDFARVTAIYYLVNIFDEMISPASDYFMVMIAFYIVTRQLELLERKENEILPYALLCVAGVFLMTVKLSAALILLLVAYPAFYLVKGRRFKDITAYLVMGLVVVLPYLIRNVIISGWLVYPFTQIDLFRVKWKIPKGLADYDAKEIQVWGRGYTDVTRYDIGIREWISDWFQGLAGSDKAFVLLAVVSLFMLLIFGMGMVFKLWQRNWGLLLVQVTVGTSFLFWLFTSPLIRYGCVYVYLTPAVVLGGIYDTARQRMRLGRIAETVCMAAVLLFTAYKFLALGKEIARSYTNDYWICQKDYDNYAAADYEIEGCTFYYPVEGDQVGYESFPSSPARAQIGFLGEDIGDGFYAFTYQYGMEEQDE